LTHRHQKTRDDDDTSVSLAVSRVSLRQGKVNSPTEEAHPPPKTPHVVPSTFSRAVGVRSAAIRARARNCRRAANTQPNQPLPVMGAARASTLTSDTSYLTCPSSAVASLRAEEAADLSASICHEINRRAVATRWPLQPPPTNQSPYHSRAAIYYSMARVSSERIAVGGGNDDEQQRLYHFYIYFYLFFILF